MDNPRVLYSDPPTTELHTQEPPYDGFRLLCNVLAVQLILATPALLWAAYRWGF